METILRVATFNLKSSLLGLGSYSWNRRREILYQAFRELDADIAGVQELTPRMRADFEQELSEYNFIGRGRCGGLLNEHSDIAVKNDFKVLFGDTFWLSKQPNRSSSRLVSPLYPLSWIFPRICTIAEVTIGLHRVRVFNTHLDVASEAARALQLKIICRRISLYQEKNPLPTLLMGDFNALPNSREISTLISSGFGYKNVRLRNIGEIGANKGTLHFFRGGNARRKIDYIFASKDFKLLDSRIHRSSYNGCYPSDHYPLIASLLLKSKGS